MFNNVTGVVYVLTRAVFPQDYGIILVQLTPCDAYFMIKAEAPGRLQWNNVVSNNDIFVNVYENKKISWQKNNKMATILSKYRITVQMKTFILSLFQQKYN